MSYIGSTPTTQSFIAGTDSFNGTGSATNFTLSRFVNSVNDIQVVVNNVVQYPPNYSVSGTTLTISPAPSAGTNNVYVRYLSTTLQSVAPSPGTTQQFASGTAANPSITFIGDTNTGIYSPSADTIAFVEGGTEAIRLNSTGNVLVGTTTGVAGNRFTVVGGGTQLSGGTTAQEGFRFQRIAGAATITGINNDNNAYNDIALYTSGSEGARLTTGNNFQFNSGYGSVATAYGCRAWVNFNGTGTVAIRASGNVSSITDNGTGQYTVNFTTAMPDANYSVTTSTDGSGSGSVPYHGSRTFNTGSVQITTTNSGSFVDNSVVCVAIFR